MTMDTPVIHAQTIEPLAFTYVISTLNPTWIEVACHPYFAHLKASQHPSEYGFLGGRLTTIEIGISHDESRAVPYSRRWWRSSTEMTGDQHETHPREGDHRQSRPSDVR